MHADQAVLTTERPAQSKALYRFLNIVERVGNKLPDPAIMFLMATFLVWVVSFLLSQVSFDFINPRTGEQVVINNLLTGTAMADFLASMTVTFTSFAPLGIVLVAMLGVGVADAAGYLNTALTKLLNVTPRRYLTPMLILVAIISHVASDAGYVLVIPIGALMFKAAGRHPLAGIAAAFAGVSGGFSASMLPSGTDPLLQGFTQSSAQLFDPAYLVNPLCNLFFTAASSVLIVLVGWYVTEKIVEPRLAGVEVDGDAPDTDMGELSPKQHRAFFLATVAMFAVIALIAGWAIPEASSLRSADGQLTAHSAPLMKAIVPLIFLIFLTPGVVYGFVVGKFTKLTDVVSAMSDTMGSMKSFMVMAFFCALFLKAFGDSNLGTLLALSGAELLHSLALPGELTIVFMIVLTAAVNLVIGSASAKWALLGPIMVPMLMAVGISPELTQAAFRVGDSVSNIISPLMVFFPLMVVYAQRYVKSTGIGSLVALMMPYTIAFIIAWTLFLLAYWALGLPLGLQASYVYPAV